MLIDLHASPRDLSPTDLAAAARSAGLGGVVVTDANRTDRLAGYLDALKAAGIAGFAGVELVLERGYLVFIPEVANSTFLNGRWSPGPARWQWKDAAARVEGQSGVLIAAHPYCRDQESVLADAVYGVTGLGAVETRIGRGRPLWDQLADEVADRRKLARVGSCGGDPKHLGKALTAVDGTGLDQAGLVAALKAHAVWPVEMEARGQSRDREEEVIDRPPPRRDDDEGGGDGEDRPRERGARGDRDRGPRSGGDRGRPPGRGGPRR